MYKNLIKFCLGVLVAFFIVGLFERHFEWGNLVPIMVGGLVATAISSKKNKS